MFVIHTVHPISCPGISQDGITLISTIQAKIAGNTLLKAGKCVQCKHKLVSVCDKLQNHNRHVVLSRLYRVIYSQSKFENGVFASKRIKRFSLIVLMMFSPSTLKCCFRRVIVWCNMHSFSVVTKLRFCHPHENAWSACSNFCILKNTFKKVRFRTSFWLRF